MYRLFPNAFGVIKMAENNKYHRVRLVNALHMSYDMTLPTKTPDGEMPEGSPPGNLSAGVT